MSDKHPSWSCAGVSKSFGAVQALYEVDFHVAPGEVMALVGDNGAGKSTLIKCIAGIYSIDSGEVVFEGEPRRASTARRTRRSLGHRGRLPGPRAGRQPRRRAEHVPRPRGARRARCARSTRSTMEKRANGHAGVAVGDDDPLGPPDGRRPVGRPAPVGGGRQGRHVELEGRDPRRADRGARRRADPPGARPGQAPRRAGPRRRARSPTTCTTSSRSPTRSPCCASARTSPSTSAPR